ncbi:tRNA (adenosine(37)-N6)-threonylcarbamoyltransferase complex dimerization subunit type 1 TsaB [Peptoniphilus asaccharolyticus]
MLTLGIDTSTMTATVGLSDGQKEIVSYEITEGVFNSEELTDMIEDMFSHVKYTIKDVELFAVGVGPGSFTGTRIAVTMARTFSQILKKPIVGVSSLRAMSMIDSKEDVLVLVDAKRKRAYYGLYSKNGEKVIIEDGIKNIDEILETMDKPFKITGTGAKVFEEKLNSDNIINRNIRGVNIAKLGEMIYKERGVDNLEEVLPNYLAVSQAEAQFNEKHGL